MSEEDRALLKRCLDGDMDAFDALIRRHQPRVCRTLYLLLSNQDDVEDVAQEVFIRVYRHLHKFRGECQFSTWLHRITINTFRNWTRGRRPSLSYELLPDDKHPVSDSHSAESNLISSVELLEIRKALLSLPDHYREALVLRYYHDLSYEDVAHALGVPLGTVRSRLSKGRDLLVERLNQAGVIQSIERTLAR